MRFPTNIPKELSALWVGFTDYKATHLNPNTVTKTYGAKAKVIAKIPGYCVTAKDVVDWMQAQYSNESNRRTMEGFIACYEWAIRTERLNKNPFSRYKRHFPKTSKPQRQAFTFEERDIILESFRLRSPEHYPFINFCFRTGCRHEEARGLEWNGVLSQQIHFYQENNKNASRLELLAVSLLPQSHKSGSHISPSADRSKSNLSECQK